jgi:hypothetical protein
MKSHYRLRLANIGLVTLLAATPSLGEEIPNALRGKTILLKWDESRVFSINDRPTTTAWYGNVGLYISAKGRIFAKVERTGTATKTTVSGVNDSPGGTPQWRFEGETLIGTNTFTRGGRRVTVTFSDGFRELLDQRLLWKERLTIYRDRPGDAWSDCWFERMLRATGQYFRQPTMTRQVAIHHPAAL